MSYLQKIVIYNEHSFSLTCIVTLKLLISGYEDIFNIYFSTAITFYFFYSKKGNIKILGILSVLL